MTTEESVKRFENAFVTLIRLVRKMDARQGTLMKMPGDAKGRDAALADAQIWLEKALAQYRD
jgi:hypothetical protein